MITYAWKFYDIAEYNDTFVVHLRLSCKKSHKKCFFLIYITIVRIDENKAYRHGGLYTSGRGQLIIFFYHSNTNTNRVSDNQSYLWKKVFKYTKTLFFNCVLQNTAGHKGLNHYIFPLFVVSHLAAFFAYGVEVGSSGDGVCVSRNRKNVAFATAKSREVQ